MKAGEIVDGKYELIRLLGEGGMGSVYEATHVQIGRKAALKFLHPEIAGNADIASRFLREAQAAAAIGSDHIVDIYDVGQLANGAPYLVMEFLEGEDLSSVLKREKRVDTARAVALVLQLCEALTPAHEKGIVHRDLKPANIFLTHLAGREGWLKVLDFGIAKVRSTLIGQSSANLTKTGTTLGTPYYMAPEQFMGARDVDPRADVYSAGVILYQMLTGTTPYKGATYEELIVNVAAGGAMPPRERTPDLSDGLSKAVLQAMNREGNQRYPSMKAFEKALRPFSTQNLLSSLPVTVAQSSGGIPAQPTQAPTLPPAPLPPTKATQAKQAIPKTNGTGSRVVDSTVSGSPPTQAEISETDRTPTAWENTSEERRRPLIWVGLGVAFVIALIVGGVLAIGARGDGETPRPSQVQEVRPPIPSKSVAPAAEPVRQSKSPLPTIIPETTPLNRWVRIEPAPRNTLLGLPEAMSNSDDRGFRANRLVSAPTYPYEVQRHEVTWQELRPWLERHPEHSVTQPTWLPENSREHYPATGVPWTVAHAYCRSLGGSLPREEEWEFAVRGLNRRPYPWGMQAVDRSRTHVYRPGRPLSQVMTNDQDVTQVDAARAIFDLLGNAQEWTSDLWREDASGQDESWVQAGEMSFRAIRGLPPNDEPPVSIPFVGAAHRIALCATGACPRDTAQVLAYVGFRCSKRSE